MEKAKKKKKKNKKSFMEKMMEAAGAADTSNNSSNSVAGTNLKSYNSNSGEGGVTNYRKGSIASKANIMQQYNTQNSQNNKEE